jgi:hypothetical protein
METHASKNSKQSRDIGIISEQLYLVTLLLFPARLR